MVIELSGVQIWAEIIRVITKLHDRVEKVQFVNQK